MKEQFDGRDKGVCLWRARPLQEERAVRARLLLQRSEISHPCRNGTKGLGGCVQRAFL